MYMALISLYLGINQIEKSNIAFENCIWQVCSMVHERENYDSFEDDSLPPGEIEIVKYDFNNNVAVNIKKSAKGQTEQRERHQRYSSYCLCFQKGRFYIWLTDRKMVYDGKYFIKKDVIGFLQDDHAFDIFPKYNYISPDTLKLIVDDKNKSYRKKYEIVFVKKDLLSTRNILKEVKKYNKKKRFYFTQPGLVIE